MGVLLLATAPAGAYRDDVPVLASGGGPTMGWVAITFTTDGDAAVTEVLARDVGNVAVATYVLNESEALRYGLLFVSLDASTPATITEVGLEGAQIRQRIVEPGERSGNAGLFLTLNDPGLGLPPKVGTFKVLLFAAGDAREWTWTFRGGPGTRIDAIAQGTDTFLLTARDLQGAVHVERFDESGGARMQAANALDVEIDRRLWGGAYALNAKSACAVLCAGPPSTDALLLQAPGALAPERCLCTFADAAPGRYAFELTGADASATLSAEGVRWREEAVVIAGSDARLAP